MPDQRDGVRIEDGPKRVRTYLGGELIADTTRPKLVWEVPYYPAYYFPHQDVRTELLHAISSHHDARAARTAEAAALYHANQLDAVAATRPVPDS